MALGVNSSFYNYRSYTNNSNGLKGVTKKLSSGYRINSAGDDAAGLAISEKMRTQITSFQAQYNNTQNEINAAQTGDGALASVHDALGRMRELAAQASNGTYSDMDRGMLQQEFSQLQEQLGSVFEGTNFNGNALLDNNLDVGSLSIASQDGAAAALDGLSAAIDSVSAQRSDFGATMNRAEHTASNLMNARINTQDAESEIRDLDVALAVMENTRKKILSQSSTAMLAQANQNTSNVMRLMR